MASLIASLIRCVGARDPPSLVKTYSAPLGGYLPPPQMHTYVSAPDPHQPQTHTFVVSVTPRMLLPAQHASAHHGAGTPRMLLPAQHASAHHGAGTPRMLLPAGVNKEPCSHPRMLLPAGGASPRSPHAQYGASTQYDAHAQYDASAQNGRAASPPPSNYVPSTASYWASPPPSNYVGRVLQLPPGSTAAIQMQQQQGRRDEQIRTREVGAVTGAPPLTFIAASYRHAEAERRDGLLERRDERAAAGGSPARHPTGARDDAHAHANGSPAPAAALHRQSSVRASRPLSRRASAAARSGRSGGARP